MIESAFCTCCRNVIGRGRRSAGRIAFRRVNHFESPLFGTRDDEPSIGVQHSRPMSCRRSWQSACESSACRPLIPCQPRTFSHQTRIHHRRRFTSVKIPAEWNLNDTRERSRWRREPFSNGISNLIMIRSCRRKFGGGPTISWGSLRVGWDSTDHDREIARRNVQSREVTAARSLNGKV